VPSHASASSPPHPGDGGGTLARTGTRRTGTLERLPTCVIAVVHLIRVPLVRPAYHPSPGCGRGEAEAAKATRPLPPSPPSGRLGGAETATRPGAWHAPLQGQHRDHHMARVRAAFRTQMGRTSKRPVCLVANVLLDRMAVAVTVMNRWASRAVCDPSVSRT